MGSFRRIREFSLSSIVETFERLPKTIHAMASVVIVSAIGYVDMVTGIEISFSLFYLLPITIAAWFVGKRFGIAMSVLCTIAWELDFVKYRQAAHLVLDANIVIQFLFFLSLTLILSMVKDGFDKEKLHARTDYLTGLSSSRYFMEQLQQEIDRARRYGRSVTVAYLDLDNFKYVNDTLGHGKGDELLRLTAGIIRSNLRSTDIVGRLGGDEFAFCLPEAEFETSSVVLQKLQEALNETMRAIDMGRVTFSLGALTYRRPPQHAAEVVGATDALMYRAKKAGKNAIMHRHVEGQAE